MKSALVQSPGNHLGGQFWIWDSDEGGGTAGNAIAGDDSPHARVEPAYWLRDQFFAETRVVTGPWLGTPRTLPATTDAPAGLPRPILIPVHHFYAPTAAGVGCSQAGADLRRAQHADFHDRRFGALGTGVLSCDASATGAGTQTVRGSPDASSPES